MDSFTVISVTSLSIGLVLMALSLLAIYLAPYMERTRAFVIMCITGGTFLFATYFIFTMENEVEVITLLSRLQVALLTVYMVGLLHITLLMPFEGNISNRSMRAIVEFLRRPINIYMFGVLLAMVPAALVEGMEASGHIVEMGLAWPVIVFYTIMLVAIMLTVIMLTHRWGDDTGSTEERALVLAAVLSFAMAWILTIMVHDPDRMDQATYAMGGVLVSASIMAVLVIRHPRQLVRPVAETSLRTSADTDEDVEVEGCRCLLVESKGTTAAFRLFKDRLSEGSMGLIIARTHPDRIRDEQGLIDTPIIWLASQPGPDRIDPTNLSILQNTILDHIRRGDRIVIMVEGIEYLISNNPVEKVLKTLYLVKDEIMFKEGQVVKSSRDMMLIIPLDMDVMSERDLALFEREFEVVRVRGEYDATH